MTKGMAVLAGAAAIFIAGGGLAIARADELSDMRANDVLLQQKIDQARALNGDVPPPAEDGRGSRQGSFPRSFRIPGTETSVRIGGDVTATVHDSLGR
jgi:type II secretory pathway pseudopilin PulG